MPKVRIDLRKGKSLEEVQAISNAIHQSLVRSIKIPTYDKLQMINEYPATHFYQPETVKGWFINIDIFLYPGRSKGAKRALFHEMVKALEPLGFEKENIMITLQEPLIENWGVNGVPADEVDLGYALDV